MLNNSSPSSSRRSVTEKSLSWKLVNLSDTKRLTTVAFRCEANDGGAVDRLESSFAEAMASWMAFTSDQNMPRWTESPTITILRCVERHWRTRSTSRCRLGRKRMHWFWSHCTSLSVGVNQCAVGRFKSQYPPGRLPSQSQLIPEEDGSRGWIKLEGWGKENGKRKNRDVVKPPRNTPAINAMAIRVEGIMCQPG